MITVITCLISLQPRPSSSPIALSQRAPWERAPWEEAAHRGSTDSAASSRQADGGADQGHGADGSSAHGSNDRSNGGSSDISDNERGVKSTAAARPASTVPVVRPTSLLAARRRRVRTSQAPPGPGPRAMQERK